MPRAKDKVTVTFWPNGALVKRIVAVQDDEQRSRSNAIVVLLTEALDARDEKAR